MHPSGAPLRPEGPLPWHTCPWVSWTHGTGLFCFLLFCSPQLGRRRPEIAGVAYNLFLREEKGLWTKLFLEKENGLRSYLWRLCLGLISGNSS